MVAQLQSTAPVGHKQGTLFMGDSASGSWAQLLVDDSQYAANCTAAAVGSGMFSTSSRFILSGNFTIVFDVEIGTGSLGWLWVNSGGGSYMALRMVSLQRLSIYVNNVAIQFPTIPNLSATAERHTLAWSCRPNPGTTGASDALQSWIYSYNQVTGETFRYQFTHAAFTVPGSVIAFFGTNSSASAAGDYSDTIYSVALSHRHQTFTEVANDWFESWTAPTTEAIVERPPLPLTRAAGIGNQDHWYGPVPAWCARNASHMRRRTWTPLVNRVFQVQEDIRTGTVVDDPAHRHAPGDTDFVMNIGWLQVAIVPPGADRVFVRAQTRQWVVAGSADVECDIRIYVFGRKPGPNVVGPGQPAELPAEYFTEETSTRNDGAAGVGEWNASGVIPLPATNSGLVYFAIAYAIDPRGRSANGANFRLNVRALHAVALNSANPGGLPFGGFADG